MLKRIWRLLPTYVIKTVNFASPYCIVSVVITDLLSQPSLLWVKSQYYFRIVLELSQHCLSVFLALSQHCLSIVSEFFSIISVFSQYCLRNASALYQHCLSNVSEMSEQCPSNVSAMSQQCLRNVSASFTESKPIYDRLSLLCHWIISLSCTMSANKTCTLQGAENWWKHGDRNMISSVVCRRKSKVSFCQIGFFCSFFWQRCFLSDFEGRVHLTLKFSEK